MSLFSSVTSILIANVIDTLDQSRAKPSQWTGSGFPPWQWVLCSGATVIVIPTPGAGDWAGTVPNERSDFWADKIGPVHCIISAFAHCRLKKVFSRV